MRWWLVVLLAVIGATVLVYGIYLLLFWVASWSTPTRSYSVWFLGVGNRWVYLHERHWLARMLPGWGQSNHPHIYLDGVLWPRGRPHRKGIDPPTAMAFQVGHELWHNLQKLRLGEPRYGLGALLEIPLHGKHRDRPREREARARQSAIVRGNCPQVKADFLHGFDNWHDPDWPEWKP